MRAKLVPPPKGRTLIEDDREQGAQQNIWKQNSKGIWRLLQDEKLHNLF
jgi:hypothetical protein